MQIMEGDLARTIEANLGRIAHIQLADNPGRNEPGTGEINYPFLYEHLDRIGYAGWVGAEYKPKAGHRGGAGLVQASLRQGKRGERSILPGASPTECGSRSEQRRKHREKIMETIGFIGLGIMGAPMAGHLLDAGYAVVTSDHRSAPPKPLVAKGLKAVAGHDAVARAADIIITMVPDTPQVAEVLFGENGVAAGPVDRASSSST